MKVPAIKNMEHRRIYIAGPMRGRPAFNYPKFNEAEKYLTTAGWLVENPARISEKFGTPEQINESPSLLARVVKYELDVVRSCDAIFLLPGWEKSEGARMELVYAIKTGQDVYICDGTAEAISGYIRSTFNDAADKLRLAKDQFDRYDGVANMARERADKAKEELDRLTAELTAAKFYMGVAQ